MKEGYKKTELGWIPEEWNNIKIGDIFELSGGLSVSREKLGNSGVCYLHYGDIHKRDKNYINVDIDKNWLPKIEGKFDQFKNSVKLEDGDIVFADASEDYEGIGKSVAILNENNKEFVSGLHTIVGKDINRVLDRNFKRFCLSTDTIRKQFRKFAVGTSVYGISRENLKKISVLVPPLEEQQKIAEILSTVDSQIDDTDKLIEKTKELKKGLMQRLLTKGIGHSEFKKSEVGEIPVEWEKKRLSEVATVIDSLHETPKYTELGVSMIRVVDVNGRYINTDTTFKVDEETYLKFTRKYVPQCEDIIMSRVGSYGLTSYLKTCERVCLGQNIVVISTSALNKKYLFYALNSNYVKGEIDKVTVGSSQKTLSLANINKLHILVPTLEEQEKIANILSSVDKEIEEYENKKEKLEELKRGLMQQLLTGKIRSIKQ